LIIFTFYYFKLNDVYQREQGAGSREQGAGSREQKFSQFLEFVGLVQKGVFSPMTYPFNLYFVKLYLYKIGTIILGIIENNLI